MQVLYFGERDKALFGAYHPPITRNARKAGVVLCYPFGAEYLRSHRAFRQLAKALSLSGFHVLRFDYFGTGDSAGQGEELSVEQALEDLSTAVQELRDMAFVRRVSLVGFRLGATLAAYATSRIRDVDALVLWDPVVNGEAFVREVIERENDREDPVAGSCAWPGRECPVVGVSGFPLTDRLVQEVSELDLLSQSNLKAVRVALITTEERAEFIRLAEHLERTGVETTFRAVETSVSWNAGDGFTSAVMIPEVQESIVGVLEALPAHG